MLYRRVLALLTFLAFGLITPTRADVIQLFSPAELSGGTAVDLPNVAPGFTGIIFNGPVVGRAGIVTVTFTAAGGQLVRFDQGLGFLGSFPAGTELVVTERATSVLGAPAGTPTAPLTISFSDNIVEFGLFAQNTFTEADEFSTFTFSVFDGPLLLGVFSRSGPDYIGFDQSDPLFLGARAILGQRITRVVISGASSVNDPDAQNNFAVGQVAIVVPEPAAMVLLGTGLAGVIAARGRKRRKTETD